MDNLVLPYTRKIDFAAPDNEMYGKCQDNVPDECKGNCPIHNQG